MLLEFSTLTIIVFHDKGAFKYHITHYRGGGDYESDITLSDITMSDIILSDVTLNIQHLF